MNPKHKPACHNRQMRNVTLSADGKTRYGICAGCGVPMQEPATHNEGVKA